MAHIWARGRARSHARVQAYDRTRRPAGPQLDEPGDEILELVGVLAENAHDIWASERMQDGWAFGA